MDETKAKKALIEIGALSSRLVMSASSPADAVVVATALMIAAEMILVNLDGPKVAADLFRDVADRLAANTH